MESVDLGMEDIFDEGLQDEDLAIPPPLPDLDDDMPPDGDVGGVLNEEGRGTAAATEDKTLKSAVKKRVLRPQPKLDAERLQSERGLPLLPKLFSNTKFKGKGHETEDLKMVMGRLEHWAHRLFPKLTFDDFTARLEKLGRTKPVQTCIKRIRLDMPVSDSDFTGNPNNDDISGNEDSGAGGNADVPHGSTMDVEEAYEEMLQLERQQMALKKTSTPGGRVENQSHTSAANSSDDELSPRRGTPKKYAGVASLGVSPQTTPQIQLAGSQASMTPEQLSRIEKNKQLAMQKRAVRLGVPVSSLVSPPKPSLKVTSDTSSGTTSDVNNVNTPKVTEITLPCQTPAGTTTNTDTNSFDTDAQAATKDRDVSDKNHDVHENTSIQDKTATIYSTDGATPVDSPKPSSKVTNDSLFVMMSDVNEVNTSTVRKATLSCPQTLTTNVEINKHKHKTDSCDTDTQRADKEGLTSDAINKCSTDGATMQTMEEVLDALESDHDDPH